MRQTRAGERRSGVDRRSGPSPFFNGPERRKTAFRRNGLDRRAGWPAVCVCCGKICNGHREWSREAVTIDTEFESRPGLCADCSRRRFPQFYSGR